MKVCIHRGTREIGGSCVEVASASGERIVLDLGLPLDVPEGEDVPLPAIAGLSSPDPSLRAIILSHGHRDHWGLLPKVATEVPLIMGAGTQRILAAAAPFVPGGFAPRVFAHLVDRQPFTIGPFSITPFLVDHSGFDAYALLVEANGARLFYSGDLRAHGRKARLFEALVSRPPPAIDLMLMEGSSLGRIDADTHFPTEDDIENVFLDRFRQLRGMALVACSAQNIDRVVTVYRAAKRARRQLTVDAYAAEVLKATQTPSIPKPADGWSDVKVWIPQWQRLDLQRKGIAPIVDAYRGRRVWPEHLAAVAPESVMLFRGWMLGELAQRSALDGAAVYWSQWDGYLADGAGAALLAECARRGMGFESIHTSGHASPSDLKRLASAIAPKRLVAIHTFHGDRFPDLFENVVAANDGEWISVHQTKGQAMLMETEMNNKMWSTLLKECFFRETGKKRDVRFPAEGPLRLGGNANRATMHLSAEAVVANMQDNKAAFEAWALVLIRWCGAEKVVMSWDEPGTENPGHYQRFLYRAMHFAELMNGRFVLATPERLDDLRVRPDADPHLNLAGSPRQTRFIEDPKMESEIEAYLVDERSAFREHLASKYDIDALDRQFPVGVFEGPPQRGREIFTGGSSAIDLIGKDKQKGIWIFEIKKRKAIPVGAVSEMLLYTLIAHDVRSGLIRFVARDAPKGCFITPEDLRGASRIRTRLTATDFHPLIDDRLLSFLNEGAQRLGWPIDFALFDLTPFLPARLGRE